MKDASARLWIAVIVSLGLHAAALGLLREGEPGAQHPEIRFTLVPRTVPGTPGEAPAVPESPAISATEVTETVAQPVQAPEPRPAAAAPAALAQASPAAPEKTAEAPGPTAPAGQPAPSELLTEPVARIAAAPALPPPSQDSGFRLLIKDQLKKHQRYPPAARRRGVEGAAVVRFVIARDGSLVKKQLVESSGSRHLDAAALRLLSRAAPYPALPVEMSTDLLEIQLPIEYRLTAGRQRT